MNRNVLHQAILLILISVLLLTGCGAAEQFKKNYQESTEAYYAPENLDGDTRNTGLLVIDAVTKKALNTMSLSGVAIINIDKPEKKIVFGSFQTGGLLSQRSGVVVVPNLLPGTYRVVKINTSNANMWETLYMPPTKEFEIEIKSGSPAYFGQIQARHPMGTTDRVITIKYDKNRERTSWKMVVDKYEKSKWKQIITEHIKNL